jgi:anti-sigma B factor antagonist
MKIKQEKFNDAAVCILDGEVDINTSPELRKACEELIRNNEKKVLIDLSGTTYIDSSGLATLIEMFQRLKKTGGRLRLSNMNEKVKNVFEITKLYKLFEIFDNREAALKDF